VNCELIAIERARQFARGILHVHQQVHHLHIYFERRLRLHPRVGEREKKQREPHDRPLTTEASHSPSTHTSPSTKYSFFQIGTMRLSRLMPSSAASNAGLRCGAVTTTATLVSPISILPSRCTIAMRPIGKDRAISSPICAIVLIAIGS